MSEEDSESDEIGSAGTGCASCTGPGGVGRAPVVELLGGGGVGRATGGFFLAQAPVASTTSTARTTNWRLCIIVSLDSLVSVLCCVLKTAPGGAAPAAIAGPCRTTRGYCDQFG